jgi:uncharacterized DUF497 family protein
MVYTGSDDDEELDADLFDWDQHNALHIEEEHGVTVDEAEEAFRDLPLLFLRRADTETERRWAFLGRTFAGRLLLVVYTWRNGRIRVVTARPPNGRESNFWSRKRG